ncbi:unnamed protein product [Closterium sp. NIES-64]|nr:unnamed protein product [Closterium sp. NIES-64]
MGDGGDYENGGEEGYAEKGQGYDGEGNAYAGEGGEEGQGAGYINQEGEEFGQDMEGGEGFAEEEENWQEGEAEDVYAMGAGMGNGPEGEEGFAEDGGGGICRCGGGGGDGREGGEGYAGEGGDGVEGEEGEGYAGEGGDGDAGEGYAGERGDGVAGEEEEGYAGEGGDGVAAEEGEEYAGEGGDGVAGEEGEGYAGEGGDGVAREEGEGYASEGGGWSCERGGGRICGRGGGWSCGRGGGRICGRGGGVELRERKTNAMERTALQATAEKVANLPSRTVMGLKMMTTLRISLLRGNVAAKKKYQSNPGKRVEWGEAEGEVGVTEMSAEVSAEVSAEAKGGEEDEGEREAEGEAEREEEGGPEVGEVVAMGRVEDASKGEGEGEAAIGVADKELVVAEAELLARDGGEVGEQQQQHISRAPAVVPTHQPVVGTGGPRPVAAAAPLNMGLAHSNRSGTAAGPPRINLSGGRVGSAYASQRTGNAHLATSAPAPARPGMSNGGGGRATMSTLPRAHMLSAGGASRAGVASYRLGLGGAGQPAPSTLAGHGSRMIPGLAPVVSPNSPVSLGRGWGSQRVNSAGGSTGQPNHTQRGWGPMASAGGGRAGAQPGGSNMGDRSQSNASGGGMNGVALGAAPSGRSSGSRGPDAAASTGSQRPVAVPRPGIGAGMPRPRAVASVSEKIAQNTYATMADLQALRDELLGQLCRRCAGCDRHDANGEGGGTQVEPVKEPVRVKSPEEIACDFINAETGGWQGVEETLQGVEETLQGVEEPLQGTEDPNLLLSPHLRLAPALLSAWQSHCKARKILTCSFPPISVPPLPYSLPGRNTAGRRRTTAGRRRATAGRRRTTAGRRRCLTCSFPTISVPPLPYSPFPKLPFSTLQKSGDRAGNTMWPFSSEIFNAGIFAASVRSGMALGVWKTRQIAFALFALEYPILEKTADGKLSSKPDYNLPLYEEKVKWCRRWVEHAVTNLGVGYVEDRDVFVFGNGILIDASDYAAGFKKTTIVLQ